MKQEPAINSSDPCFRRCTEGEGKTCFKYSFKTRSDRAKCWIFALILTCLLVATILPSAIYAMADEEINSEVVIDSTSAPSYNTWVSNTKDGDFELYYKVFLFDIQNYQEVTFNRTKPVVTEVGPYAFREYFQRFDISWQDGGDTITYNTQKYYVFDAPKSNPGVSEDDMITLPYLTALGFEFLLAQIPPELQAAFQQQEAVSQVTTVIGIMALVFFFFFSLYSF